MVLFKRFLVHSAPTMVALRLDSPPTIFSPLTKNPGCTTKSTCMIFKLFSQKAVYFADFLGKTDSCCVQKSFAPGCRRYAEFKIFRGSMPRTPSNYMPTARASRLRICKKGPHLEKRPTPPHGLATGLHHHHMGKGSLTRQGASSATPIERLVTWSPYGNISLVKFLLL